MTPLTGRLLVLAGVLLAGIIVVHASVPDEAVPPREALARLAPAVGSWRSTHDVAIDDESLKVLNADDYVSRAFVNSGRGVDLFIAYYASQRQGETMHSPLNCLPATGWQPMSARSVLVDAKPAPVVANQVVIQKGLDRQLVVYWYQSHGRTLASEYASKAYLVLDSLRLHRSDAAIVRVVTPLQRLNAEVTDVAAYQAATDFVRALRPQLQRYIPD